MARFLLILSVDANEAEAQRIAERIVEDWWSQLRLEGVYQEKQLDTPTRTA